MGVKASHSRFPILRRRLAGVACLSAILWLAAAGCYALGFGVLLTAVCVVAAILTRRILPVEEMRDIRLAARGWRDVDILTDTFRAASLFILFLWLQSIPEFWALVVRLSSPSHWDWRPYTALSLWFVIRAWRDIVAIQALSDRHLFRYYLGDSEEESAEQFFRRIG